LIENKNQGQLTKPLRIRAHRFFREPQKYFLRVFPLRILAKSTEHKPNTNVVATPQPITSRLRFKLLKIENKISWYLVCSFFVIYHFEHDHLPLLWTRWMV